nr:hypothetical protein [Tanacetum cinerariifolium]
MAASYLTAASDVADTSAPVNAGHRRSTTVNDGQRRRPPTVNAAGHRSTATDHGGDRRSTVAVNDGRRWQTTVDCRWTTFDHHRTTVDHHRTTGQRWLVGRSTSGSGSGPGRVWIGSATWHATFSGSAKTAIPPKTTTEKIARRNELKAKSTLLLAILDEHLLKFHGIKDAKTLWEEIRTSLNEAVNTAQNVYAASSQGQAATSTYADDVMFSFFATQSNSLQLDNEDLDLNEAVNTAQNVYAASSQGQAATSTYADDVMFSFFATQSNSLQLDNEDLERGHFSRECRELRSQGNKNGDNTRRVIPVESPANALVVTDGMGYDLSYDFALMAFSSSSSSNSDNKTGLGYDSQLNENALCNIIDLFKRTSDSSMNGSEEDESQANDRYKTDYSIFTSAIRETVRHSALIIEDWESDSDDDYEIAKKSVVEPHTYKQAENLVITNSGKIPVNAAKQSSPRAATSISTARYVNTAISRPMGNGAQSSPNGNPQYTLKDQGIFDSGCSRHMTGNKSFFTDYQDIDGGFVAFRGSPKGGKIIGKGTIRTGKLDFEDVYVVKELKFNLFSVSQMCDKKNNVLFTETECLVQSPDFKLSDENQVLLRVPKQNNMYSFDLKNVVPTGDLTCLFVKATIDEKKSNIKPPVRPRRVEENMHIRFLENKPSVAGRGPEWLFDIDSLTNSMHYEPVTVGNKTNHDVGLEKQDNAVTAGQEKASNHDYILLSFLSLNTQSPDDKDAGEVPDNGDEGLRKGSEVDDQEKTDSSYKDVNTTDPSINTASLNINTSSLNINDIGPTDPNMPYLEDTGIFDDADNDTGIFDDAHDDRYVGAEANTNNLDLSTIVSPIPTTRVHKDHPKEQILRDLNLSTQTRRMLNFLKKVQWSATSLSRGTNHKDYQNCLFAYFLSQHEPEKVLQALVDPSWIEAMQEELLQFKLQKDERGIVIRNKARFVAQGHTQEEGIDYDEVFAPVTRIEAIKIFLAYVSFMGFIVYQMDLKSAFLYGTIEEENGFRRCTIDKTLFIKKDIDDILLVQVYVDDIIFGSTKKYLCDKFEQIMHKRFQMSSMGELTFFLGLQVKQKEDGIFISQDKYVTDILKKFEFTTVKTASTPMEPNKTLVKDAEAEDVDVHLYRSMIGSLMYLTTSRPDIIFVVCACARFQVTPKTSHLHAVKRIFKYLKGQPKLGLWYPRDSPIDLEAFSDSDYTRASLDRKSIIGEYVAATSCCGQTSAKVKTVNDAVRLQALIDGKKVIVDEASIRRDLRLDDAEGTTSLLNDDIFAGLERMVLKPLHGTNLAALWHLVLSLEQTKTTQEAKIKKLKKSVRTLEGKQKKRTHGLKRMYKVGLSERVESSVEEEGLGAQEDASKQGRIAEIDVAEDLFLVDETAQDQGMLNDQDMFGVHDLEGDEVFMDVTTGENTLMKIKAAKPKAKGVTIQEPSEFRTTSPPQPPQDKDKGKAIMVKPEKPMKKKDQIAMDEEIARKLEAEMKSEMEKEERIARERYEENKDVQDEVDDTAELRRCLEIVLEDDDDVAIEATPLSSKSPTIVDYKIYREGKKSYFKSIRAGGNSQNYLTFGKNFKNFNREDLDVLRSLFKERFEKSKPVDDMKNLLFQTL